MLAENCLYTLAVMARRSKLKLPPVDTGGEPLNQRIARLRKERGYTQTELAERIGIIQALVSDYECGKLRLSAEMAIRFAMALEVTTDELLRSNGSKPLRRKPSRRVLRRMERIQDLPPRRQYFVLKALDALLSSSAR